MAQLNKEERSKSLNKIQEMFKKATENSDNKVQIAMQMYEMVRRVLTSVWHRLLNNVRVLILTVTMIVTKLCVQI